MTMIKKVTVRKNIEGTWVGVLSFYHSPFQLTLHKLFTVTVYTVYYKVTRTLINEYTCIVSVY